MPTGDNNARTFSLGVHADYRCHHSGACCTAGWPIPVERELRDRLTEAVRTGSIRGLGRTAGDRVDLFDSVGLSSVSTEALIRTDSRGACVFFQAGRPNLCAIHRDLGETALPASCRHFPRICLIDARGVFVTLSHFCPTAASALFQPGCQSEVVENPPAFPAAASYEGLDARAELPPLLRPGMLAGWDGYDIWERLLVSTLLRADLLPEEALRVAIVATETVRPWTPSEGPIGALIERAFDTAATLARRSIATHPDSPLAAVRTLDEQVRASVPPGLARQQPIAFDEVSGAWSTEESRPAFAVPVRRYLASHAFANWSAYQGRGFRTVLCSVVAAHAVLRVEAARQCAAAARPLDDGLLLEAFRQSDLVLRHLASREDLARRFTAAESWPLTALLAPLG